MKKLLLTAFIGISSLVMAQDGIEITVNTGTIDYSSGNGTYQVLSASQNEITKHLVVTNNTGSAKTWLVTRLRINEIATWEDYLCWGECYTHATMPTNPWTTPGPTVTTPTLNDGAFLPIDIYITPDVAGTTTYRYYLSEDGINYVDSIDVEFTSTLSLEEVAPEITVGVSPNPASEYVNITATGVESANVKMVDVLGNVVLKETMKSTKHVDVSKLRNGIYFIMVEAKGAKTVSRKVIVRH